LSDKLGDNPAMLIAFYTTLFCSEHLKIP